MRHTVHEIRDWIAEGQRTARAVTELYLKRIEQHNSTLHCFREVYADHALQCADAIDEALKRGDTPGPLAGVPLAIKDNIASTLGTTACGSRMLETYRSPFDATVVHRLGDAGAIIIGRTNCDEFAMGSSSEHCAFGAVRNPWDAERVPGGSSGGSAAAVAAGLCPAALGSDTGGSIRQPAALCGVTGVRPSYGRVSRYGLVAFGSSLDQIGPITVDAADAALLMQVICGNDPLDSTCADRHVPHFAHELTEPITDLRLGVPRQSLSEQNDPSVNDALQAAVETFTDLGAEVIDIDLPLTDYGIATYYILAPAEASSNLARYDGIRYGRRAEVRPDDDLADLYARSRSEAFGPEVQRRIMLGTYVLSAGYYEAYYKRALQVRRLIAEEYARAFEQCHAIIGPTSPFPAFPIGAKQDPLSMYLCDVYTTNTSIAGIAGMSVPCGFKRDGAITLPIGLQIQCPAFDESTMLRIANMFEQATDFAERAPLIADPADATVQ